MYKQTTQNLEVQMRLKEIISKDSSSVQSLLSSLENLETAGNCGNRKEAVNVTNARGRAIFPGGLAICFYEIKLVGLSKQI